MSVTPQKKKVKVFPYSITGSIFSIGISVLWKSLNCSEVYTCNRSSATPQCQTKWDSCRLMQAPSYMNLRTTPHLRLYK